MRFLFFFLTAAAVLAGELPRGTGYHGIWYYNQPLKNQYSYKYSGGFATYPQQQSPIAIYVAKERKTFFCYGGTKPGEEDLMHMVSYYDHRTGMVPRPVILVDKKTDDAHDNPVMSIDDSGYIWIFSDAHGTARPSFIWRSDKPYSIDGFSLIRTTNFSYAQPWFVPGKGFFFLHTLYRDRGRSLFWSTSADGVHWSDPSLLSRIDLGHYEITAHRGARTATVFNYHPSPLGLNARTNIYYLETTDMGKTWTTVDGRVVKPPLHDVANPALVHDYRSEHLLVYLKTVQFDAEGRPVILFLTSKGWQPGPSNDPRQWKTARWTGKTWEILDFTTSDHNYDYGSLYIEPDGTWRVIGATAPGPQPYMTGGDIVLWLSHDRGHTWHKIKQLTFAERYNHSYPREPIDAQADFYALWADGDTHKASPSSLYFTDKEGTAVWRLPLHMDAAFARPEKVQWHHSEAHSTGAP